MNQLIKLTNTTIGQEEVQTINARELHSFLEVGKDFSNWIKDRIDQYGFVENEDYLIAKIGEQLPSGTKHKIEYHLSLDMAKELSMVERNEKGKQARQYFIECEKKAKQLAQSVAVVGSRKRSATRKPTLTTVGRFCFDAMERMIALVPGLKPEIAAAHALEQIRVSTGEDVSQLMRALPSVTPDQITTFNATEIGRQIGVNPRAVNITLLNMGMIRKDEHNKWRLTEAGTAFGEMKPFHRNGHSDYEIRWKESVIDVLLNHLTNPETH